MLNNLPPVLKNLLIINILAFFAAEILGRSLGIDFNGLFGLHYFQAEMFNPFQLVTYMFMHGDLRHLFFNMFGLFMFGRVLEQVWGGKRFLIYYFVTGIGAAIIQQTVQFIELRPALQAVDIAMQNMPSEGFNIGREFGLQDFVVNSRDNLITNKEIILNLYNTVGASGAVFGVLLAFGMLFPNTEMFIMFVPVPIKAKYMVMGYGIIELVSGVAGMQTNVAHFAHLGGMLFGYFLIRYWRKSTNQFY